MKTFKTALAVFTTALLPLALFASPSSGAIGVDDQATVSGSLYQTPASDTAVKLNPPFYTGQEIKLYANFTGGVRDVTFYKQVGGGSWTVIGTDEANSSGNAYLNYTIAGGEQKIYAEDVNDAETETDTITGETPPPSSAVLDTPATGASGKTFTAHFTPIKSGQTTQLQVQEICTYETDETNPDNNVPFDEAVKQKDCQGPWTTRATSKQDASGNTTFSISDPLEVKHKYRAVSGLSTSNTVQFAAPLPTNPYGTDTGLSELHFNSYEGDAVDTRSHYFEGAFTMTASEKNASPAGTPCAEAKDGSDTAIMKSVMKGRGNYSWSFPKKSFTLKIGKKLDLCGLGKSKKYALVANDYDKSLMRNSLASYVGQKFNKMGWTPKGVPVEFYVNGSYRGSYLLIERIAIQGSVSNNDVPDGQDPDTLSDRVNVHELNGNDPDEQVSPGKTGGYIMEWDFRKGADYDVNLGSDSGYVGIKEPENDYSRTGSKSGNGTLTNEGISSAQKSYISDYLNDADSAMRRNSCQSGDWEDYIDKDSAVDYYLAMEYMKPVDGNMWASVYMYKPRGEKIHFGPMWDFDLGAGSATRAGNVASSSSWYLRNNLQVSAMQPESATKKPDTWFNCLNKRSSFRSAVASRWNQVQGSLDVGGFIDDQKSLLTSSASANFKKWSHSSRISSYQVIKSSWSSDVSYLRGWATGRKSWINGQL